VGVAVPLFELFFNVAQRFEAREEARQLLGRQTLSQEIVDFVDCLPDRAGRCLSARRIDQIGNSVSDGAVTESYVPSFDQGLDETYSRGFAYTHLSKELSRAGSVGQTADHVGAVPRKVVAVHVREVVSNEV
jgi:hypothetical protein